MKLRDYRTGQFKCVHRGARRYICAVGHQLAVRLPQAAVLGGSLFLLGFVIYKAVFFFIPGNVLLNISSATIPTTRLGDKMVMTICRSSRIGTVEPQAMRTFYKIVNEGSPEDGGSYSYTPTIEGASGCYIVKIDPKNYPKEAGTYYAFTSFRYKAGGFDKESTFTTPPFLLSDAKQDSDREFERLKQELCALNVTPKPALCSAPDAQ